MALSITSAFRLRNKLKEKISKLTFLTSTADITKPAGKEENRAVFDGKTFKETIAAVCLAMETLRDFNLAIEKANGVNKGDLIALESLKAELAFYESLAEKFRRVEKYSYEYNPAGGRDKIELEPVLDQKDVVAHLGDLKKQKDAIEERLTDSNFKTTVEFDQARINKLL
jgi:hypothetical protein